MTQKRYCFTTFIKPSDTKLRVKSSSLHADMRPHTVSHDVDTAPCSPSALYIEITGILSGYDGGGRWEIGGGG
jgi:hypothetical protein